MIEIKNLSKVFYKDNLEKTVLNNINLEIENKEIFGIIGLSGAGKSTLVRTINFLEKPTTGSVIVDSVDLSTLSKKELLEKRKEMGMIFQNYNLLNQNTILKNVCLPLLISKVKRKDAIKRAKELLDTVGLKDRYNEYPSTLSGGERQRVAIARALALNPKYLLCDEITSALDPQNTKQIINLLKEINKKFEVTIVFITHEMKVIEELCDRVAVIDNSEIVEIGKVDEIFKNPKTKITHDLLLKDNYRPNLSTKGGKRVRIIFDGLSSNEPILSSLILDTKASVNVIFANTKVIDDEVFGHMIVEVRNDDLNKVYDYLNNNNINYKEEEEEK